MKILSAFYSSFLLTILPLLLLSSCSWDNLNSRNKKKDNNSSNTTVVAFELSDKGGASTYALDGDDDSAVSEIHILLFNTQNQLINAVPKTGDLTQVSEGKVEVKTTLTTLPYGNIVLLANASAILNGLPFAKGMTYSAAMDLLQLNLPDKWNAKEGSPGYVNIPMYGETGYVDVRINNNVFATNLIRMLCRVDVNVTDKALINFKLTSVHVYNRETRGMLAPSKVAGKPAMPTTPIKEHTPLVYTEITTANISIAGEIFLMESLVASALDDKARLDGALCLVVGGIYDGEECFYRVDFAMDDTTGEDAPYPKHFYNPLRNHHYQINITAVLGAGEEKPDEAFKKETALIKVDVLDWGKGGAIDGDIDGKHVLRLSQGEFNLPFRAHTSDLNDVTNKLSVSSTHPEGWYIEKITKEDGTTTSDWLSVDLPTPGSPQMTGKTFSLILTENNGTAARVGYIFIKSGSRMVYKVKVTQRPKIRLRSIAWSDYDDDAQLTFIKVEEESETVQVTDIDNTNTFSPIEIESTIAKVKLLYMGYWLDVPASKWSISEDGTKITVTDRSLIGKPIHLDKIRLDLTGNYLQIADIDLATYSNAETGTPEGNWVPIGINTPVEAQFSGSYDGGSGNGDKGFTITNLNINRNTTDYVGLFGYAGTNSSLKKIHIDAGSSIKGKAYVGSVCGYSLATISECSNDASVAGAGNNVGGIAGGGATITSCTNNAVIKGDGNLIGGICGSQTGTPATSIIRDCKNLAGGTITAGATSLQVGGIAGNSTGTISACTNAVPVTALSYVGGICGVSTGAIENCNNTVAVEATGATSYVGGIAGQGTTITGCTNNATITGAGNCIGGICGGQTGVPATSIIRDCKNLAGGIITVGASSQQVGGIAGNSAGMISACSNAVPISGASLVGGIVGYSLNNGVVEDCHNTVTVTGTTGNNTGGIVGWGSTIIDCSNSAIITGLNNVGGICGKGVTVSGCTNTALVTGVTIVGGISGDNFGAMKDCTNSGNVKGTGTNIGGIVGSKVSSLGISNCHNSSQTVITEKGNAGGIAGSSSESPVTNCTNTASVTGTSYTGGICGYATGAVTACWNKGNIVGVGGRSTAGGIVGYNIASIVACYNIASVTASANAGAIHGTTSPGTVTDCYYGETSPATGPGTKFGEDPDWPTEATPGWEEYPANPLGAWTDLGSWNGGINPSYPTLK